jgi:hypothetical protein
LKRQWISFRVWELLTVLGERVSLLEHVPEGVALGLHQDILLPCERLFEARGGGAGADGEWVATGRHTNRAMSRELWVLFQKGFRSGDHALVVSCCSSL